MINFYFALLMSVLIGWLAVIAFTPNTRRNFLLDAFLSVGLGLGICAQITFYSFLAIGEYNPTLIISLNILMMLFLFFINRKSIATAWRNTVFTRQDIVIGLFFLAMFDLIFTVANSQPFGQWDAWAVWNMKTKFLVFGGAEWKDIFQLHWHTQPDYPLLLPFINTWLFAMVQNHFQIIPSWTSVIFTGSGAGLLYAGLTRYIPWKIALLAAFILVTFPTYHFFGTTQYADITLSYYLLAAIILLTTTLREKHRGFAALLGMALGLMCFAKNEGLVMAIILALLAIVYLRKEPKIIGGLLLGLLLTTPPALILKIFLAPPNRDMGLFLFKAGGEYFNLNGLWIIIQQVAKAILGDPPFFLIWTPLLLMFLLQPQRYFKRETQTLTLFFLFYLACIILIYLTTIHFNLAWRISRTLSRILIILLPAVLFLNFYAYWRKDD